MKTFHPDRLRNARLSAGFTLQELSSLCGGVPSKQALNKWEMGEDIPKPENLQKVAKALGAKVDFFYREPTRKVEITITHWHKLPEHLGGDAPKKSKKKWHTN